MSEARSSHPWHIAVLIPARNEELLLERCLASVQRARKHLPWNVTSDVVLVSDCSTDHTEGLARKVLASQGAVMAIDAGCVGTARATAAELALSRYCGSLSHCWLANTDADCLVPATWLTAQLALAERGAAALAGIVDVDDFAEHRPQVRELFRLTYKVHADGTHPHIHGANLGVRADAYLRAGGWGMQATAEDHDLWRRLQKVAQPCVSDAGLKVTTSGRRVGRAPSGFADALSAHNEAEL